MYQELRTLVSRCNLGEIKGWIDDPAKNINASNVYGETVLMYMVKYKKYEKVVDLFLTNQNIDINKVANYHGRDNNFALLSASSHFKNFKKILRHPGVEVNNVTRLGNTVLHLASDPRMISLLLQHSDIDPNIKNREGDTPLMEQTSICVCRHILNHHLTNINILGKRGTALVYHLENKEIALMLLARPKVNLNIRIGHTPSVLFNAAYALGVSVDVIDAIIAKTGDINQVDSSHNSAFMLSIWRYWSRLVAKRLLKIPGLDFNIINNRRENALILAAQKRITNTDMVETIIARTDNINHVDSKGNSALMYSVRSGSNLVTDRLLKIPGLDFNIVNKRGENALICLVSNTSLSNALRDVIVAGTDDINKVDHLGSTALIQLIERYRAGTSLLKYFLELPGLDFNVVNKEGVSALSLTLQRNLPNHVMDIIIARTGDINQVDPDGCTIYMRAVESVKMQLIDRLQRSGRVDYDKIDHDGNNALMLAAMYLNVDNLEEWYTCILQKTADVNLRNKKGNTALMLAIQNRNQHIIPSILRYSGTDLGRGRTWIGWYALEIDYLPIYRWLYERIPYIKRNIMIDGPILKDGNIYTALIAVIKMDSFEIFRWLIQNPELDINRGDRLSKTPLMWIVSMDRSSWIEPYLQRPDIDIDARDLKGFTALGYACYHGNREIVEILLSKGCRIEGLPREMDSEIRKMVFNTLGSQVKSSLTLNQWCWLAIKSYGINTDIVPPVIAWRNNEWLLHTHPRSFIKGSMTRFYGRSLIGPAKQSLADYTAKRQRRC